MSSVDRPARPSSTRRLRRLARALAGVAALASVATGVVATSAPAHALNPAQTQYSGVVNLLGFNQSGSIATFWSTTMSAWGARYAKPRLVYYRTSTVGLISTPCGTALANNSFYCSTDNTIYLDYTWNQQNTTRYGDFGSGGILAHEWGHAVDAWLGYSLSTFRSEYHADCLAGMYARYGYATGRLVGSDYSEMWNWLYAQPYGDGSHGTGAMRADWYRYGYQAYSLAACNQAYSATAKAADATTGTSYGVVGVSAGAPVSTQAPAGADRRPVVDLSTTLPSRLMPARTTGLRVPSTSAVG